MCLTGDSIGEHLVQLVERRRIALAADVDEDAAVA
jgi:hypothetical protein